MIDPVIVYSTFLGGPTGVTTPQAVAVDSVGNVYVTGNTTASDFPTANSAQPNFRGMRDGFVTKLNASGTDIIYSTYLGGVSDDYLQCIAVDSSGNPWVAGYSRSVDFPLLNPYQGPDILSANLDHVVLAKLTSSGALAFSTFLRSAGNDYGSAITVDGAGNAYLTGSASGYFPTTPGAYNPPFPAWGTFIAKFSSNGALVYSALLKSGIKSVNAIAVDSTGNVLVTGSFSYGLEPLPPVGGIRITPGAFFRLNAYVAKLDSSGSALLYFAVLAGTNDQVGRALSIDSSGNVFLAGTTNSPDFPTLPSVAPPPNSGTSIFVTLLNSQASALLSSRLTPFDSKQRTSFSALALDQSGNVVLGGNTSSSTVPIAAAVQPTSPVNLRTLFRTVDGGTSWTALDQNIPDLVYDISPDPVSPDTLMAATASGVVRSTDNGASWTVVVPEFARNLARSATSPSTLYMVGQSTLVYRSTDGGGTWSQRGYLPFNLQYHLVVADPLNANVAYAYSPFSVVYKTVDGGVNWIPANSGLPGQGAEGLSRRWMEHCTFVHPLLASTRVQMARRRGRA